MISRNIRGLGRWLIVLVLLGTVFSSPASSMPAIDPQLPPAAAETTGQAASPVLIHLVNGSFDPLQALPNLPDHLAYTPAEAAEGSVYLLQFAGPVMPEWKQAVLAAGGQLGDYVPDYAFLARLDEKAKAQVEGLPFVRWVGPFQPAYKLALDVDYADSRSYRVILAPWADAAEAKSALGALAIEARSFEGGLSALLNGAQLDQAARLPAVVWIEPYHLQRTHNDIGGGTIMGGSTAWSNGYTASGVTVAIADTGLDTGVAGTIHQDFAGRVTHISSWPVQNIDWGCGAPVNVGANDGADDVESGHGTHVSGSVAGNGAQSSGLLKGLAYQASITFQALEQWTDWPSSCGSGLPDGYYLTGIPDDVRTLLSEAYTWGARSHNNSWGGGEKGVYDQQASYFDQFIHEHPDMAVAVSAGNAGKDADNNGYVDLNSISSPGTSKNVITVGASDNERASGGYSAYTWGQLWSTSFGAAPTGTDLTSDSRAELAAFSSRGPMADGRIKPDVVAPGTNILSVRSSLATENGWGAYDTYYMYMGGTSMASPLVTGAAAVVRDYYIDHEGHANPSAALVKATLINSAVDIAGYGSAGQEAGQPIPNMHEGWGRVNVAAATTPNKRQFVDNTTGVNTGATATYNYNVVAGQPFKVSLVWSDHQGSPLASPALVNNLNLKVTAPNGTSTYWGNNFSGGWTQTAGSADTVNNVENVYIQSPTAGKWKVEVIGANVPQGPQPFALVVNGNIAQIAVDSITPTKGPNNASLNNAVIRGSGFESGATAQLVRGASVINGTGLTVNTTASIITATFNLNGATPGLWGVRVVNSVAMSDTLENAFSVIDATKPDMGISKTAAQSQIDPGRLLDYEIVVRNQGYAAATGGVFTDTLPAGVIFDSISPACSGGMTTLPDGFACDIAGTMSFGDAITYTLTVSVPASVEGVIVNSVVVDSNEPELAVSDNTDSASVTVGVMKIYLPIILRNWPPVPSAPTLNAITPNPSTNGSYNVSWAAGTGPAPSSYDVEENGTVILTSYASTTYNATGKANGTYTYRVRGKNSYGTGPWSGSQSVTVQPATSGPTPGFWESYTGEEFYVTTNRANVDNFAVYISVSGCGNYKITHNPLEPITNNQFSFSGSFYASGTFNSSTTASGTDGLSNFYIPGCGNVSGGPWSWNASWKNSTQPSFVEAHVVEVEPVDTLVDGHYEVVRID